MSNSNISSNRTSVNLNVNKGTPFVVPKKMKTKDAATGILIPETNERCIVFPFDRKKLKYMRDTYQKQSIAGRCTAEDITRVISKIEESCNNFKRHRLYKTLIYLNVIIGVTVLLGSIAVIIAGLVKSNQGDKNIYSKSGQNMLTMIGILIFGFDVLVMYFGIVIVGCLSNDLSAVYIAKYDTVFDDHKKEFEKYGMRWKIGTKRLWLELWMDEYVGPNRESKDGGALNKSFTPDTGTSKVKQQRLMELRRGSNDPNSLLAKGKRASLRNSMMLSKPGSGSGSHVSTPQRSQNTTPKAITPSQHSRNHAFQFSHKPEDQL